MGTGGASPASVFPNLCQCTEEQPLGWAGFGDIEAGSGEEWSLGGRMGPQVLVLAVAQ